MQKSMFDKIGPWTSYIVDEWSMYLDILDILMRLTIAFLLYYEVGLSLIAVFQ